MLTEYQRSGGSIDSADGVLKLAKEGRLFFVVLSSREASQTTTNIETVKALNRLSVVVSALLLFLLYQQSQQGKQMDKVLAQLDQNGKNWIKRLIFYCIKNVMGETSSKVHSCMFNL